MGTNPRPAATDISREAPSSGDPIIAAGVADEGPRPSDPGRPICDACGIDVNLAHTGRDWLCATCWRERYGTQQPRQAVRVPRTCECGCGRQIVGRRSGARYATDACKSRAWRASTGYRLSASRRRVRHDKSGRSGLQVSVPKLRENLLDRLWQFPGAERLVDQAIRASLSEAQRTRLDERRTG